MNVLLTRVLTLALTLLLSAWSFITSADTKQSADASAREQRTVHLASLDWPPYAGSSLPGGGASVTVRSTKCVVYLLRHLASHWPRHRKKAPMPKGK